MKKIYAFPVLMFLVSIVFSHQASAGVPVVDSVGLPAYTVCQAPAAGESIPATIYYSDKIVFRITGQLQAKNTDDQQKLSALPLNTELDIKVRDNPKAVSDLAGKVLSFLGASPTPENVKAIAIKSVTYAAATCPASPLIVYY